MHGAMSERYVAISERERERVSSWESYISPTTSVGINPGQFILLNLFRLAQIVIVSQLLVNGLERSAIQARITAGRITEEWWKNGGRMEASFRQRRSMFRGGTYTAVIEKNLSSL